MLKNKKKNPLRFLLLFLSLALLLPTLLLPASAATPAFAFPHAVRSGRAQTTEEKKEGVMLLPGGQPFGVRLHSAGVMVVSLSAVESAGKSQSPAKAGGVCVRDIILAVNGQKLQDAAALTAAIRSSGGKPITLDILRGEEKKTLTLTPVKSDKEGQYSCGMYVRDSASGIGTVTFVLPDCGLFGGLGHGVCDSDTGALVPLSRGNVLPVEITGVVPGKAGKPGELRGSFSGGRLGSLVENSECGVFGLLSEAKGSGLYGAMPAATADEVKEGEATILCTLGEDGVKEYKVEISKIDRSARPTKSFTVQVTDKALLARTGGIVQGMSGSPILQNGKIIGAVTHVLVDDPTTGYGIFVENMLSHMKMKAVA